MEINNIGILNITLVFFLGAVYSFIELLNLFKTVRSFFKTPWGCVYVLLNGGLSVGALMLTFKGEINTSFLGFKLLVSGTSALALLRVIVVPIKHGSTTNNFMSIIDTVLNHVRIAYDRRRSKDDMKEIKKIMKDIDYIKAAESLPPICGALLKTLSESDGLKMNEDIQKLLALEEGNKEIKAINLGIIFSEYIGIELLRDGIDELKEFISFDRDLDSKRLTERNDIDTLIDKFS